MKIPFFSLAGILLLGVVAKCVPAACPDRPFVRDEYTRLLYHCDGRGAVLRDAGPLHLDARLVGAVRRPGRFGQGLDTRHGGGILGYHPALNLEYGLTLEAWVRVDGPADDIQRLVFRSGIYGFYLDRRGRTLTFFVNVDGRWTALHAPAPQKAWTYLAGTYDGRTLRLYVNGVLRGRREIRGSILRAFSPLEIGGEILSQRRFFNGCIDEIRISSVARRDFSRVLRFEPTLRPRRVSQVEPVSLPVPQAVIGRALPRPTLDGRLDDALWENAFSCRLHGVGGRRATAPTTAECAWGPQALYLAVRCTEPAPGALRAAVKRHDGPVWTDDCVEFFLQPPGSRRYYHVAINPAGTVYDAACRPRPDSAWESGIRVRTARDRGAWTVEAALPFRAFGRTPKPGEIWRLNICRERKHPRELSSWAPVGARGFHAPAAFAKVRFGAGAHGSRVDRVTRLEGIVCYSGGRRAANVPVRTVLGTVTTDVEGRFIVEGLPRGRTTLSIRSPRFRPMNLELDLAHARERVRLPDLDRVNPNQLSGAPEKDGAAGFRIVAVPALDDLVPPDPARLDALPRTAAAFACPGEYEPLGAVILAGRALRNLRVRCTALAGPGNACIPESALDVRLVKRLFVRTRYSAPVDDVALRSRYLLPMRPFSMAAGSFRRVHVIVHVPENALPGRYRGALEVGCDGVPAQRLPLAFDVLGFRLDPPKKHYGLYYRRPLTPADLPVIRMELADIRAHGADRLIWLPRITYSKNDGRVRISYDQVVPYLDLMQRFGFRGPYIVWDGLERLARFSGGETSPEFLRLAREAIQGLQRLRAEHRWPEVAVTHMDEVFGRNRLDRFIRLAKAVRQVPDIRIYITFHNRPLPGIPAMIRRIDPFVDIRCYHGHSMDEWLAAGHSFSELAAELRRSGDEAWCYYNPRSIAVTPEWARICNGWWLWLSPITTHVPWAYSVPKGNPLDDADGYDFGYAFSVDGRIVPTRLWEGYREGVDDERYLTTLENAVRKARRDPARAAIAEQAAAWLQARRQALLALPLVREQSALVKAVAAKFSNRDYNAWRRQCADFIQRLEPPAGPGR